MTVTFALIAAGLVAGLALMWRVPTLPRPDDAPPQGTLAVVVPARDEAARLPTLLASLAAQTRPADRVVVVDDASTDATGRIARAWGADVADSGGPPEGWAGKAWACHVGTSHVAAAAVVVLLDADVRLAPDALHRLSTAHRCSAPDGLLSVQPYHETERAYEQLSAVANVVAVMASGFAAARARRSCAVAFGPCLVTTPAALADVGGFASVRHESIEDVALAARYRARRRAVRCVGGAATVRFRMYGEGVGSLVEGWTKNLAGGARRAPWWSTLGATLWVAGAMAAAAGAVADPSAWTLLAWAAWSAQLAWMLRRIGRFRWWTAAAFPVPTLAFVALFTGSVLARGVRRSVVWRGRRIAVRP